MYKHTAEAVICVTHSNLVINGLCASAGEYCRPIRRLGMDRILDFGDARAILRPIDDGLLFRVEARDLMTFYGIRSLLQGGLSTLTTVSSEFLEWRPAEDAPFRAFGRRLGKGQDRLGKR